jgi:hypothetical protein
MFVHQFGDKNVSRINHLSCLWRLYIHTHTQYLNTLSTELQFLTGVPSYLTSCV